jgi:hypothetical protein
LVTESENAKGWSGKMGLSMDPVDLDVEIDMLKDKGDRYLARGLAVPEEIRSRRKKLVALRWEQVPEQLQVWCEEQVRMANIAKSKRLWLSDRLQSSTKAPPRNPPQQPKDADPDTTGEPADESSVP